MMLYCLFMILNHFCKIDFFIIFKQARSDADLTELSKEELVNR